MTGAALVLLAACDRYEALQFDPGVKAPAFPEGGPTVLVDQGHHNHHRLSSGIRAFRDLLQSDGFDVRALGGRVTAAELADARIFAIVTAQADTATNAEPAFTEEEVAAVARWVRNGGSLLLVMDHYPFANSVQRLADAFGLEFAKGMTFDPVHHRRGTRDDSRLVFSRSNRLLASHPITRGRSAPEAVGVVETFTGDSIRGGDGGGAVVLLQLSGSAVSRRGTPRVRRTGGDVVVTVEFGAPEPVGGWGQAVALPFGRGRVVVLADATMITVQEDGGQLLGMNAPGNHNRQFLLNTMHWLAGLI